MEAALARHIKWITLAALLLPLAASAQWLGHRGGAMDETEYRKSDGAFGAWLVQVADDRALYQAWSAPGRGVHINEIDSVEINAPISAFVVFAGCKADDAGNCNVLMRYRVLAPDGSIYADTPVMEVWSQRPAPPEKSLQLSVDYLKIIVEPHEQAGKYTVQVQVNDVIANKSLRLEKSFLAIRGGN